MGVSVNEYDAMDRLKKKVTLAGAVYYDYDLSGKKLRLIDADDRLNYYVYDQAGRLEQVVLDGSRTADYEYDRSGMLKTKRLPNSKVMSYYEYDVAGRLKLLRNVDENNALLSYFGYDRNENGAAVGIEREGTLQQNYEYDALDRLTLDELRDGATPIYGFRYHYDAASNRARKDDEVQDRAVYYAYDARNLLMREVLSHTGAATYFDYDQALRLRVEHSASEARYYEFDQRDQPTQIRHEAPSDPDVQHDFSYNGLGERVRVAEGSTEAYWSYDGAKLIRERLDSGTLRRYRHNKCPSDGMGSVIEIQSPQEAVQQYPAFDHRGSTQESVALVDEIVPAVNYYQYDAFGVRLGQSSTIGGSDAAQRMQFASPIFVRLNTTPSQYLTRSGVYMAERGMGLVWGLKALVLAASGGPFIAWRGDPEGQQVPGVDDGQLLHDCGNSEGDEDPPEGPGHSSVPQEMGSGCPGFTFGRAWSVNYPFSKVPPWPVEVPRIVLQNDAFLRATLEAKRECDKIARTQRCVHFPQPTILGDRRREDVQCEDDSGNPRFCYSWRALLCLPPGAEPWNPIIHTRTRSPHHEQPVPIPQPPGEILKPPLRVLPPRSEPRPVDPPPPVPSPVPTPPMPPGADAGTIAALLAAAAAAAAKFGRATVPPGTGGGFGPEIGRELVGGGLSR
ncbi:MAG: RHS repeat protein [Planctomycetota bacterium]|nr:RHS repeat protein [Planctomycetota bacterium]